MSDDRCGVYDLEHSNEYWSNHWKQGRDAQGWRDAERNRGDSHIVHILLRGLNLLSKFDPLNLDALYQNEEFFEKYSKNANIFVPMCGDTPALKIFFKLGFNVTGAELAESALRDFIREMGDEEISWMMTLDPTTSTFANGCSACFVGVSKNPKRKNRITLFAGDIFKMKFDTDDSRDKFDIVFDRAAIVALLKEDRGRFIETVLPAVKKSKEEAHPTLFSNVNIHVADENKIVVSAWLLQRMERPPENKLVGPPFVIEVEEEMVGHLWTSARGFEKPILLDVPSVEEVIAAQTQKIECATHIYRTAVFL